MSDFLKFCCALGVLLHFLQRDGVKPQTRDIDYLFKIGDKDVDLQGQEVVLLVGGTGSGISTLSKFVRRDPSLKIQQNKANDFVYDDGEDIIGNEDNHMSKTQFPRVEKDEQSGALLIDCVGFVDTRHPMFDLLSSFFAVFKKADKMKIVMVENFEHLRLSSDRTSFMRSIKQLAEILQDNVAAFEGSIGLVAAKADSIKSDEHLKKSVNTFLKATVKSLIKHKQQLEATNVEYWKVKALERQILLVQFLAAGDKVAIFRRPNNLQRLWTLVPLKINYFDIRDLIFKKLHFLEISTQKLNVSVSTQTEMNIRNEQIGPAEVKVKELFEKVANSLVTNFDFNVGEITSQFLSELVDKRRAYGKHYLIEFSQATNTTLYEFFKTRSVDTSLVKAADLESRQFKFLHSVVGSNKDSIQNKISNMFGFREAIQRHIQASVKFYSLASLLIEQSGKYEIHANKELFQSEITSTNYMNCLRNLLVCGIDSGAVHEAALLTPISDELQVLNKIRSEMMTGDIKKEQLENFVGYTGRCILASQIKSPKNIKGQLVIKASHKFFLDKDLELIDAHLTIVAPIVEVVGINRSITMRGSSGVVNQSEIAAGLSGSHGQPGHVSGDIYILALDIINAKSLQILSLGGGGAAGQAGGNGREGRKCEVPLHLMGSKTDIELAVQSEGCDAEWVPRNCGGVVSDRIITLLYNAGTESEEYELKVINHKWSEMPTNGGDGGNGGAGAPPGEQKLFLKNSETQLFASKSNGKCGLGGKGGLAGGTVPVCASVKYLCMVESRWSNLLGFIPLSEWKMNFLCEQSFSPDCDKMLPAASDGKDGVLDDGAEEWIRPQDLSATDNLQAFIEAFAHKNGNELKEFLEFLVTLKD